jgi:hypothetical protein
MHGHALDLKTFRWLPQPSENANLPPARLRLASETVGEWLVLYGGHGEFQEIGERVQLHKLNLRTLKWGSFDVQGREASYPAAPAATFTAGLVLGGVRFSAFGISPVPKLDVLLLGDIGAEHDTQMGEPESPVEDEDSDENDGNMVAVVVRDMAGNARRVVVPRGMLGLLAAGAFTVRAGEPAQDDSSEDDDEPDGQDGSSDVEMRGEE